MKEVVALKPMKSGSGVYRVSTASTNQERVRSISGEPLCGCQAEGPPGLLQPGPHSKVNRRSEGADV